MQVLFNILFIMMILVFLIGMIRPEVFTNKKTGEVPDRKTISMGSISLMLISLVMAAVLDDGPAAPAAVETTASAEAVEGSTDLGIDPDATVMNFPVQEKPQELKRQDLGITADTFKVAFNRAALSIESDYKINQIDVKQGQAKDTFNISFGEHQALIGTVNSEGKLDSVMSISTGDGTIDSGINMMLLSAILVRAVSPDMGTKQAGDIAVDLIQKTNENGGETVKRQVGNVEYYAMFSKSVGFWFGAEGIEIN